jgi:hypothetical protein
VTAASETTLPHDNASQQAEVDANCEQFMADRAKLLVSDYGRFALYRSRKVVAITDTLRDAVIVGQLTGGWPFSIQEITNRVECIYVAA